jgi:hypothetical protein
MSSTAAQNTGEISSVSHSIGLLVYRNDPLNGPELLVRSKPLERILRYTTPYRDLAAGENAVDCARRVALSSFNIDISKSELADNSSAVINNLGKKVRVREFMIEATPPFEEIARHEMWRGWKYAFVPLSSLEYVYLHPDIKTTRAALKELISAPNRRRGQCDNDSCSELECGGGLMCGFVGKK